MLTKKMERSKEIMTLFIQKNKKGRIKLALWKGQDICHAKQNGRTLKEVKRLSLKKEGRIFIVVFFAALFVGMLQSKKGNGFLSSHHCLWNSPWSRVLKQYPIGALSWLRFPEHRTYTKQDTQFQRTQIL